jgi:hypothetical protein
MVTRAARDGDLRAVDYQKVGVTMAANSAHVTWLDDIKVVRVESMTAVTAKTATW